MGRRCIAQDLYNDTLDYNEYSQRIEEGLREEGLQEKEEILEKLDAIQDELDRTTLEARTLFEKTSRDPSLNDICALRDLKRRVVNEIVPQFRTLCESVRKDAFTEWVTD